MTEQEILQKAIEKAIKNGWVPDDFANAYPKLTATWKEKQSFKNKDWESLLFMFANKQHKSIIFSLEFAKAFWGNGVATPTERRWQYHLQQMVLEENPIKYLERYL